MRLLKYFALLLLVAIITTGLWFTASLYPSDKSNVAKQDVTIVAGMSHAQVAALLKAQGLVKNASTFEIYTKITRSKVIPGIYEFSPSQSASVIADELSAGHYKTSKITLIEGWRATDIENYLVTKAGLPQMKGFASLAQADEGYLFPDTYDVPADITQAQLLSLLKNNFKTRTQGLTVTSQDLIIASIVEREAGEDSERPAIAAVYLNRLHQGMALQADPTIQYALGSWKSISVSDYKSVNSPYNTYLHTGLPPGPISNPGLKSIQATLNPDSSSYLYFFTANNKLYLSTTYQEHLAKIAKYLN